MMLRRAVSIACVISVAIVSYCSAAGLRVLEAPAPEITVPAANLRASEAPAAPVLAASAISQEHQTPRKLQEAIISDQPCICACNCKVTPCAALQEAPALQGAALQEASAV